jgi:hypothetical protein
MLAAMVHKSRLEVQLSLNHLGFIGTSHLTITMAIPDAEIHPRATGAAAKLVAAHQDPAPLTLYSGWFCPFVQRIWAVLEEKKIPYQYVEVRSLSSFRHSWHTFTC